MNAPAEMARAAEFDQVQDEGAPAARDVNLEVILDVAVTLSMEVGRTRVPIRSLLKLGKAICGHGEQLLVIIASRESPIARLTQTDGMAHRPRQRQRFDVDMRGNAAGVGQFRQIADEAVGQVHRRGGNTARRSP